jgi:hypothetical protein
VPECLRMALLRPTAMTRGGPLAGVIRTSRGCRRMTDLGRYCCKSLFALVIKNSPGCRRDFRVKMWGTSSPDDKLTGDLGNVIETTQIGGRRSDRLTAGKLSPGNFGLLQQYLPIPDSCIAAKDSRSITSSAGQNEKPRRSGPGFPRSCKD